MPSFVDLCATALISGLNLGFVFFHLYGAGTFLDRFSLIIGALCCLKLGWLRRDFAESNR